METQCGNESPWPKLEYRHLLDKVHLLFDRVRVRPTRMH